MPNTMKIQIKKDVKFEVGDHLKTSKHKDIFAKVYAPNWSEEVLVVSKIKNTVPRTYVINKLNGEEIAGSLYEKEMQKSSQKEYIIQKVFQRKRQNKKGITPFLLIGLVKKIAYLSKRPLSQETYKNESLLS